METAPQPVGDAQSHLYHTLEDYDWDNDVEFQGGLRAILNTAAPDQTPRLIARAKCYYFARYFHSPLDITATAVSHNSCTERTASLLILKAT